MILQILTIVETPMTRRPLKANVSAEVTLQAALISQAPLVLAVGTITIFAVKLEIYLPSALVLSLRVWW